MFEAPEFCPGAREFAVSRSGGRLKVIQNGSEAEGSLHGLHRTTTSIFTPIFSYAKNGRFPTIYTGLHRFAPIFTPVCMLVYTGLHQFTLVYIRCKQRGCGPFTPVYTV